MEDEYSWEIIKLGGSATTTTRRLQDKIARIKRYKENSFVSLPLTYGKLCGYCSKRVPRKKRHLEDA